MANIPLSQIPNAPQGVFTPTADPHFSGDVIGDQAKSDIRQGFGASMVDPSRAGALGKGLEQAGEGVISGATGVARGVILSEAADRREELQQAYDSGIIKFYANRTAVQKKYQDLMADQPVSMGPSKWLEAAGNKGENFSQGQTPMERYTTLHEAMRTFYGGVADASNRAHQDAIAEKAGMGRLQFASLLGQGDYDGAAKINDSMLSMGISSKAEYATNLKAVAAHQQLNDLQNKVASDPDGEFAKQVQIAGEGGGRVEGYDLLSPTDFTKSYKVGQAIKNYNLSNLQDSLVAQIDSGIVKTPEQIKTLPQFQKLDTDSQKAVIGRLTNDLAGTPAGELAYKQGSQLVQNYPAVNDSANVKQFLDAKNWIIEHVPSGEPQDSLVKALKERQDEMAKNNGHLTPDTSLHQYIGQSLTTMLHSGYFGKYDHDAITGGAKPEAVQATLKALGTKEDILQKVLDSGPQTRTDADAKINELTRNIRAGFSAKTPAPAPAKPSIWHWLTNSGEKQQPSGNPQ